MPDLWPGCTNCGEAHPHPDTRPVVHLNRPTEEVQHGTLICPWHRVPEEATYRDEEYYGRYGTMACGARLMGDEWWPPEGMGRRTFNRLDREVRPEHYAKYDARRGERGRFARATTTEEATQ